MLGATPYEVPDSVWDSALLAQSCAVVPHLMFQVVATGGTVLDRSEDFEAGIVHGVSGCLGKIRVLLV